MKKVFNKLNHKFYDVHTSYVCTDDETDVTDSNYVLVKKQCGKVKTIKNLVKYILSTTDKTKIKFLYDVRHISYYFDALLRQNTGSINGILDVKKNCIENLGRMGVIEFRHLRYNSYVGVNSTSELYELLCDSKDRLLFSTKEKRKLFYTPLLQRVNKAMSKDTDSQDLEALSFDLNFMVRKSVAKNKNTSKKTLERLIYDEDREVVSYAKKTIGKFS